MHSDEEVTASNLPAGQEVHPEAPPLPECLPEGHAEQTLSVTAFIAVLYLPGSQSEQLTESEGRYWPSPQS